MGEGGQGGDKRKGEGQEREIVDVGGDIKKVKGRQEREKLKAERRRVGHLSFYVGSGSTEKKVKLKEIKR